MSFPELTHLQCFILHCLAGGQQRGRSLREHLADQGVRKTGPAFYQLMARMEDSKHVKGWYEQKVVEGQPIKERHYEITAGGLAALRQAAEFYRREVIPGVLGGFANG
jgi:Transcriptional regulator PadR-like family